ncbi:hypothetical protein M0D69_42430 [Caballeronia sp. SEWSISQ10-4 2]|uniref:hypothetical protein n=1 Tax=Caballeronia sp. SEWSISQ10-4 2 TaxID=2937438 RepID=UPI002654EADD|nr:hypothetical protein [Caballeronia sp. SEWSISQ10-4 2]MDN7184562.1 hypothetical protein [Caballeronia sp. SEWSISQ10-4 2]
MSGPLTQTLAALQSSLSQVGAIQNLPAQAGNVQRTVCGSFAPILNEVPEFQSSLLTFITSAKPSLDSVIVQLAHGANGQLVSTTIAGIASQMAAFQSTSSSVVTTATSAMSTLTTSFTTLSGIEGALQTQIAGLQGQLGTASGEMEGTQKRYYYLLALGPFGLVGLSVALGLYLKWKGEVSDLQGEINSLNSQIASLQSIVLSCKALATSESQVLQDLTNLKNAIDAVISDFTEIEHDLAGTTDPTLLQTVARAADAMLVTLEADAS